MACHYFVGRKGLVGVHRTEEEGWVVREKARDGRKERRGHTDTQAGEGADP